MSPLPAISRPIELERIGAEATVHRVEIGEQDRAALAAELGLIAVSALSAEFGLRRDRDGTIRLEGRLAAEIVQSCVVSLEPVEQIIDEPIELRFVERQPGNRSSPVDIEPTGEDPPEIVSGPFLDLGPIVVEHFILAIDPYPHAPGAEAPANPAGDGEEVRDSPFSGLAGLVRQGSRHR